MKNRVLPFLTDVALVVLFVFIGTRNHNTDDDEQDDERNVSDK